MLPLEYCVPLEIFKVRVNDESYGGWLHYVGWVD